MTGKIPPSISTVFLTLSSTKFKFSKFKIFGFKMLINCFNKVCFSRTLFCYSKVNIVPSNKIGRKLKPQNISFVSSPTIVFSEYFNSKSNGLS